MVEAVGWGHFFLLTFVIALPGLWAVWRLRHKIEEDRAQQALSLPETV